MSDHFDRLPCILTDIDFPQKRLGRSASKKNRDRHKSIPVKYWSGQRDSNSLPPPWQGGALPNELCPRVKRKGYYTKNSGLVKIQIRFFFIFRAAIPKCRDKPKRMGDTEKKGLNVTVP